MNGEGGKGGRTHVAAVDEDCYCVPFRLWRFGCCLAGSW